MTRQRLRDSLGQAVGETCPCCQGQGTVISALVAAHDLLRQLAWEVREFPGCRLTVKARPEVIALAKKEGEDFLREIQEHEKIMIHFIEAQILPRGHFDIIRELQEGGEKV
jgi:ribonuclease G